MATTIVFASVLLATCPVMYAACLARLRMEQLLPRQEFHLIASVTYWFAFALSSAAMAAVILGTGALLMSLARMQGISLPPMSDVGWGRLSLDFAREMIRGAAPTVAFLSLVAGPVMTARQRWRCDMTGSQSPT